MFPYHFSMSSINIKRRKFYDFRVIQTVELAIFIKNEIKISSFITDDALEKKIPSGY